MPGQTRTPTTTTPATTTGPATGPATTGPETAPQGDSGNSFRASLLAGSEPINDEPESYFAQGINIQRGMKGETIKRIQQAIGAGTDGGFGPGTEAKVKAYQKTHGLPETGVVDAATWAPMREETRTLKNAMGEADFQAMWDAHPHNYQADASMNTSSEDLVAELGMAPGSVPNTCALRMSTMMNRLGGNTSITASKGKQAGLDKMRAGGMYMPGVTDPKTVARNDKVIVSAREMWTYIEKHRGKPDLVFPPRGRYKTQEEAEEGAKQCEEACAGSKGLVAFDKIYGYGGSGHVDLFNGRQLSDGSWYPSEQIKIWFVVKEEVAQAGG